MEFHVIACKSIKVITALVATAVSSSISKYSRIKCYIVFEKKLKKKNL